MFGIDYRQGQGGGEHCMRYGWHAPAVNDQSIINNNLG